MPFDPNPLFYEMVDIYHSNKPIKGNPDRCDKVVICNEGSTRSSKTWDFWHFLDFFCNHNQNAEFDIYVFRDTLKNCRELTFKDFKKCLTKTIEEKNIEFRGENSSPYASLYGNNIYFRGLDIDMEAAPSDIVFFNESLEMDKEQTSGWVMRCRKLVVYDWNPKYTSHWCFDLENNPNTFFTHSTYKQNKHLEQSVKSTIEGYCPWLFEDFHIPENKRRPNLTNIKNGTIDEYRWKVYGEGIRAAPEGIIFPHVNYIDKFPDIGYSYGMDFGFTVDPLVLVKHAETSTDIYLELLCYQPIETPSEIDSFMTQIGIEKNIPITADSSDKHTSENKGTVEMVRDLYKLGWLIFKVRKTVSVMHWLLSMKNKRINIINNHLVGKARKEQENYVMKKINGIAINQPEDKFNHFWDASRYAHMAYNLTGGAPVVW